MGRWEALLFPPPPRPGEGERALPDWPVVHRELRKKGVTLQLLWQEYRAVYPEGYVRIQLPSATSNVY